MNHFALLPSYQRVYMRMDASEPSAPESDPLEYLKRGSIESESGRQLKGRRRAETHRLGSAQRTSVAARGRQNRRREDKFDSPHTPIWRTLAAIRTHAYKHAAL